MLLPFPAADYAAWREDQVERRRRWQFGPLCGELRGPIRARSAVDELAPADGLSGTYLHRVLADGEVAGWVWLSREDGDLVVLDAEVDAPAADLLALLEARARGADARALVLDRMADAPTTAALRAQAEFTVTSLTMVRTLDGPEPLDGAEPPGAPEPPGAAEPLDPDEDRTVHLVPMSPESFAAFYDAAVDEYARELRRSDGLAWEEAVERSRAEYRDLLPDGLATDRHALLDVVDATSGECVGGVWIGLRPPHAAFVYDLYLRPEARGRGLGRAAMHAVAQWCRARGVLRLGLSVAGHNAVALHLYESLGFRAVVEAARRPLPEAAPVVGPR